MRFACVDHLVCLADYLKGYWKKKPKCAGDVEKMVKFYINSLGSDSGRNAVLGSS